MNRKLGTLGLIATAATSMVFAAACGGAGTTNNDQGIAVTFLGYFQTLSGAGCATLPTTGLNGLLIHLGTDDPEPTSTASTGTSGSSGSAAGIVSSSSAVAVIGIQNNLQRQYYRADRLLLSYYIPGASIQPPNTTVPLSMFAGPGSAGTTTTTTGGGLRVPANSSLPPTFGNVCNRVFSQTTLVPSAIREWMNFNRDSLPEPPFQMEAHAVISGVSSAGDRFDTQGSSLLIEVLPEVIITPTVGEDTSTGALTDGTSALQTTSDGTVEDTGVEDLGNAITSPTPMADTTTTSGDL